MGLALAQQPPQEVKVKVWEMANPEDDDAFLTDEVLTVKTLFCPMSTRRPRKPISSDAKDKSDKSVSLTGSQHEIFVGTHAAVERHHQE